MLILDDREVRINGLDRLLVRRYSLPLTVARLEYADISFEGSGPGNRPVLIGIERKRLSDLIQSMTDRRLAGHQLRGLWSAYSFCYLLIESCFRPSRDDDGIEVFDGNWHPLFDYRRRGVSYQQVQAFISSLELISRLIVARTADVYETAAWLNAKYHWWQKPWSQHHSQDQIYAPGPDTAQQPGRARFAFAEAGDVECVAARLPGVDMKAWDVGRRFKSVPELFAASESDWLSIPGIGPVTAQRIMAFLHGTTTKNGNSH